jgi:hypothetical protein
MEPDSIPKTKAKRGDAFPGQLAKLKKMTDDAVEKNPLLESILGKIQKQVEVVIQTRRTADKRIADEDEDFRAALNTVGHLESCIRDLPDDHPDPSKHTLYARVKELARRKGWRV